MAVKLVKKAFRNELIFCVFINKGRTGDGCEYSKHHNLHIGT